MKIILNTPKIILISLLSIIYVQHANSQVELIEAIDASAQTLPYDDNTINILKSYLSESLSENYGWIDEIIWIKGIVKDYSFGAIHGKCGTKKGEVFYFSTVIKGKAVGWIIDSFSEKVVKVAEEHLAQRESNVNYYLSKLSDFEDTLYNSYVQKYESITNEYQTRFHKLESEYSEYFSHTDEVELSFLKEGPSFEDCLDKISDVIVPIDMYSSQFASIENSENNYLEIISKAIADAKEHDEICMNRIMSEKEVEDFVLRKKTEFANKKAKSDSLRALKKETKMLKEDMQDRIVKLLAAVKSKSNKKLVKSIYSEASLEQKQFFDKWLEAFSPYPSGTFDYSYGLIPGYRAELLNSRDDKHKLEILRYWDKNLKYWEDAVLK